MSSKKYLASANTVDGFKNLFSNINLENNSYNYILKGGPGTGKSTLMKKVGCYFEDKGENVEYFYCSSDSSSLDGVKIRNVSIVDGTAPHIIEAKIPRARDEIINLGNFVNNNIKKDTEKIEVLLKKKAFYYEKAYKYFYALKHLVEIEKGQSTQSENFNIESIFKKKRAKRGKMFVERNLFCSYISPNGYKNFYHENKYEKVVVLKGRFLENQNNFFKLKNRLREKNISFTNFASIFNTDCLEAIEIVGSKTLIISEDCFCEKIEFNDNNNIIKNITKKIATCLLNAKKYHKRVENFYIRNMNFDGIKRKTKDLIFEIENRI